MIRTKKRAEENWTSDNLSKLDIELALMQHFEYEINHICQHIRLAENKIAYDLLIITSHLRRAYGVKIILESDADYTIPLNYRVFDMWVAVPLHLTGEAFIRIPVKAGLIGVAKNDKGEYRCQIHNIPIHNKEYKWSDEELLEVLKINTKYIYRLKHRIICK